MTFRSVVFLIDVSGVNPVVLSCKGLAGVLRVRMYHRFARKTTVANHNSSLAIIGAGPAGLATFISAVLRDAAKTIYVVDPNCWGPGLAYGNTDEDVLCNSSIESMSIVIGRPLDFFDYLVEQGREVSVEAFAPRAWAGAYLTDRFAQYLALARRSGIDVVPVRRRFRSLRADGAGRYALTFGDGQLPSSLVADNVIFCSGHGAPRVPSQFSRFRGYRSFVPCVFPEAEMLARIGREARVLVLGTKLSAVDAALLLLRQGHLVTMISPSGEIPAVRKRILRNDAFEFGLDSTQSMLKRWDGRNADDCPPALKRAYLRYARRTLARLSDKPWHAQFSSAVDRTQRLREEIEIAERGDATWQDLMFGFIGQANEVYLKAPVVGGLHPMIRTMFARYSAAIALENAKKLLRAIDDGKLRIERGIFREVAGPEGDNGLWRVDWGVGAEPFDAVVGAAGFHQPNFYVDDSGELAIDVDGGHASQAIDVSTRLSAVHSSFPGDGVWFAGCTAHRRLFAANGLYFVVALADKVVGNMVQARAAPVEARLSVASAGTSVPAS